MADTSERTLRLLSVLGTGGTLTAGELADRVGVSRRTVRRDLNTLNDLGYDVVATRGVAGGYRLGGSTCLPPVVFDEDQAVAAAVALQTVPSVLADIRENAKRALATLQQAMPERSRLHAAAFTVTSARNYWEFPAPPIDADLVRTIGTAISRRHLVRVSSADTDDQLTLEPHDLVVWAARWYLVAFDVRARRWRAVRLDRLTPGPPTHTPFDRRDVPRGGAVEFVMSTHDRGDVLADWPCRGSATLSLPASVVARYAPGGATVEHIAEDRCRFHLGAWSWAGVAGLLLTFDADISDAEPTELRETLGAFRTRIDRAVSDPDCEEPL